MIFEVRKGRECSAALTASLERITALENLNHTQGQLIEIRGQEVRLINDLDKNWSFRLTNQSELFAIEKSKLKNKNKRKVKIIIVQSLIIVVLVIML